MHRVINLEGIKSRTSISSSASDSRNEFSQAIRDRDLGCMFTGAHVEICEAMHIIPRARGDAVSRMMSTVYCG